MTTSTRTFENEDIQILTLHEARLVDRYLQLVNTHHWSLDQTMIEINDDFELRRDVEKSIVIRKSQRQHVHFWFNDGELDYIDLVIREAYKHDFDAGYVVDVINERNMSCEITQAEVEYLSSRHGYVLNKDFETNFV